MHPVPVRGAGVRQTGRAGAGFRHQAGAWQRRARNSGDQGARRNLFSQGERRILRLRDDLRTHFEYFKRSLQPRWTGGLRPDRTVHRFLRHLQPFQLSGGAGCAADRLPGVSGDGDDPAGHSRIGRASKPPSGGGRGRTEHPRRTSSLRRAAQP